MRTMMEAPGLPLLHALGWTLLHFCWQGAVAGLLLWCWLGVLPARWSRARYGVACAALALMVALPAATFARLAKDELAARRALALPVITIDVAVSTGGAGATLVPLQERVLEAMDQWAPWLPVVWLTGMVVFLVRLDVGLTQARRMRSAGTEAAAPELLRVFEAVKARLGVARAVRLAQSALVRVPTVIGWLRPVVLLPVGCFLGLSEMQVEALLAHELAHIRRYDYLVSVLQSMVETLLFYHPAVWWVSRQVRRERECCCDDLAVRIAGDRLEYARALSWLEERRAAMPEVVLGANGGVLTMRIKRLLGYAEAPVVSRPAVATMLVAVVIAGSYVATLARAQARAVRWSAEISLEEPGALTSLIAEKEPMRATFSMLGQSTKTSPEDSPTMARVYRGWLNEDVLWIITPEERAAFLRLTSDAQRDQFIAQFWRRRDAPGTAANSFKDEHYARIAYANEHFGAKDVAGWKTDRGHIYIAYGRPDEIDSHPSGGQYQWPAGGGVGETYPLEVWHYRSIPEIGDNVDLQFVDTCRCGDYHYTVDRLQKDLLKGGPGAAVVQSPQVDRLALAAKVMNARRQVSYQPKGTMAQTGAGVEQWSGAIEGSVVDQTGAVVAGTKVTATNTGTGVQASRITDASGRYSFSALQVGSYTVEVVARGFQRLLQQNVLVEAGHTVGLNLRLSVGAAAEVLDVTGAPVAAAPAPAPPAAPVAEPGKPLRVSSGTIMGNLISRVDPVYPAAAKAKRVQGAVVLHAVVSKTGTISDLTAVSGPMELVVAAAEAVQQWQYKPYLLNGEPTEVETTITVNFSLAGAVEAPKPEGGADVAPKKLGPGITPPVVTYESSPEYTPEAKQAKFNGIVLVNLWVDEQGSPTHVHVLRGVGMGLDEKAIEAVKQYRFKPAMEDGKPVAVQINVEVNFQIF